ncbi:kinase-like protein, partial [Sodiomyces alkalinus F11]
MAQTAVAPTEPFCSPIHSSKDFFRTFDNRNGVPPTATDFPPEQETMSGTDDGEKTAVRRRPSRQVVPGLPRVQTFKRQQSEQRTNLAPAELTPDERRAVSVDRRAQASRALSQPQAFPRASAPGLLSYEIQSAPSAQAASVFGHPEYSLDGMLAPDHPRSVAEDESCYADDAHSYTTSAYDAMINEELERTWILNLSMHFRDKSKREKFFVTYWDKFKGLWRRVTVSLDYRHAPENSLEMDLDQTKYQREKSAKIYEAIRESLQDIQFYDTVTNLKLQTTDGRLHVHVVEDVNEIIPYPLVRQVQHLGCLRVRERDILFDSHMSGFVYKVNVGGLVLVKKEIPGPETVDEFLYEINALSRLRYSRSVIRFYGVVVDDQDEYIKGLLISYADQGALIDVLYDNRQDSELGTPWPIRERWARQIVEGLADIHESGFVQGDFTLSNIVIDDKGDAKIIDINRRGCPVGWEPPEATAVIESGQRLSMYIGVKSDLYQLGMVLWSLATQEDNPEEHSRPLVLEPDVLVPEWYRRVVERCLSQDPRGRPQASTLLTMFPQYVSVSENEGVERFEDHKRGPAPAISVNHSSSMREACLDPYVAGDHPGITTVNTYNDQWPYLKLAQPDDGFSYDPYYYTRGRSPPSPLVGHYPHFGPFHESHAFPGWASAKHIAPSYSDVGVDEMERLKSPTPTTS